MSNKAQLLIAAIQFVVYSNSPLWLNVTVGIGFILLHYQLKGATK